MGEKEGKKKKKKEIRKVKPEAVYRWLQLELGVRGDVAWLGQEPHWSRSQRRVQGWGSPLAPPQFPLE